MISKINKTALALAAALVAGSTSTALAYEALDATTGLRTELYYAPIYQLEQGGAPISAQAKAYLRQHPPHTARRGSGKTAYGKSGGADARAQVPGPVFEPGLGDGNWRSQLRCIPEFDGAGAPVGPYCFE
jgi:hypothetical protein